MSDVHVYLLGPGKTFRELALFKTSSDWVPYVGMFCFIFAIILLANIGLF